MTKMQYFVGKESQSAGEVKEEEDKSKKEQAEATPDNIVQIELSEHQLQSLRDAIAERNQPSDAQFDILAHNLKLSEQVIRVWFQNQGMKQGK